MKQRLISKIQFFNFILIFLIFLKTNYCDASRQEKEQISRLDLNKYTHFHLSLLNDYLSKGNILNYFKIRQVLLSLSHPQLVKLENSIEARDSWVALKNLCKKVISKMERESLLFYPEEIFINNMPAIWNLPFYERPGNDLNISELNPFGERLYFFNLKLNYKKNSLVRKTDTLWISPKKINLRIRPGLTGERKELQFDKVAREGRERFVYHLINDNQSHLFYIAMREWFKKYEEGQMYPALYDDMVILRNEYRIFCLDILSGEELWSFSNQKNSGLELYQTFRHPHQDPYGYEFLLDKGMIFTELGGKLICIKLNDIHFPQLIWERSLGEYTVCTKPVRYENYVIVGLVNAKGELWVCGFDALKGNLVWNTYIGTTSIISPVCMISAVSENGIYIGTNHGVLISLNPNNGEIIWLKKYIPKKYSLFDFWFKEKPFKGYFRDVFSDSGSTPFDTQFIKLEDNGALYYKPRESDYLYVLNSKNGESKEEILIDSESYYVLGVCSGKMILLNINADASGNSELKVLDMETEEQIYSEIIPGKSLRGVCNLSNDDVCFKVDGAVFIIKITKGLVKKIQLKVPEKGWLLSGCGRFLYFREGRSLSCLDIYDEKVSPYIRKNPAAIEYLEEIDSIKSNFSKAAHLNSESAESKQLIERILKEITEINVPLGEIISIVADNLDTLRQPAWRAVWTKLDELYGKINILFNEVEIKFSNFLKKNGLINTALNGTQDNLTKSKSVASSIKSYSVRGERMRILPVHAVNEQQKPLDFFILLNFDQILCVNEDGSIRWDNRVFYSPLSQFYYHLNTEKNSKGHLFGDDIEVNLYKDVLIVNDRVNIIALDVRDGSYIWSMTNTKEMLEQEEFESRRQDDQIFNKHGIKNSFFKNIMLQAIFIGDRMIIIHGNKIYSLDPLTGFCDKHTQINIESAMSLSENRGKIYILAYPSDKILMLNEELQTVAVITLKNIIDISGYAELTVVNKSLFLQANSGLYMIDEKNNIKDAFKADDQKKFYIEEYKNNDFLVIFPFSKVISYHLNDNNMSINWEYIFKPLKSEIKWKNYDRRSNFYFVIGEQVLMLYRNDCNYFLVSIDLKTGKKQWDAPLEGAKGQFFSLSEYVNFDGVIKFIISTCCSEICKENNPPCVGADQIIINSMLFELSAASGKVISSKILPMWNFRSFESTSLFTTKKYFVYLFANYFLNAEIIK